jgi:uncharacterized protein (DUF58 family)
MESDSWFLFGVETLGLIKISRFPLFNAKIEAQFEARLLSLGPGESREIQARGRGLKRGCYQNIFLVQRTLFPFGLISKFKLSQTQAQISVLPPLDFPLLESWVRELQTLISGIAAQEDFS